MNSADEKYVQDASVKPAEDSKASETSLCAKCQAVLSPQQHRCPNCGGRQSPLFVAIFPVVLVILAFVALIGGIIGGLTASQNEVAQALTVMVPVFLFMIAIAYGLYSGKTWGWHMLTVVLGLLMVVGIINLLTLGEASDRGIGGLCAGIFFWSSVIYTAVTWRTARMKTWRIATIAYGIVNGVPLILFVFNQAGKKAFNGAIVIATLVGIIVLLIVLSYSIPVRRWYRVRLGWTGKFIDESTRE